MGISVLRAFLIAGIFFLTTVLLALESFYLLIPSLPLDLNRNMLPSVLCTADMTLPFVTFSELTVSLCG